VLAKLLLGTTSGGDRVSPFTKCVDVFVEVKVLVEACSRVPCCIILVVDVVEEEVDGLGFLHVTVMAGQIATCREEDVDVAVRTAAGVEAGGVQFVSETLCSGDHARFAIE